MGKVHGRATALVFILLMLLGGLPAGLPAQEDPAGEIAESRQRLEQIRQERSELRDELVEIRAQVSDVSSELRNIEQQVVTSADLMAELELQVLVTDEEIERSTRELRMTRNRLAHRKTTLNHRLRDIYKRGPLHTAQVLLTADSFSELLNRYKYLYLIARSDRALVNDVASLEHQLRLRDGELKRSLERLEVLQEERSQEHGEMERLEVQRRQTLSDTRQREQTTSQRYQELEEDEKRLGALIATLERKRREMERLAAERAGGSGAASSRASGLSTRDLGALGWPVDGTVVYQFGRSVQPNGTAIRMNGIGIAAPTGTPVEAVEAGTVMMAGPFEGYGPTVIIHHGGGYYSLYLYLDAIAVREGMEIERGQSLGTVGGDGTKEGPHVEFQIRAPGGRAVDPLVWLQERG